MTEFYTPLRSSRTQYALITAPDHAAAVQLAEQGLPGDWTNIAPLATTARTRLAVRFPDGVAAHVTAGPSGSVLTTRPTAPGNPLI